jgi:hypothetical protein
VSRIDVTIMDRFAHSAPPSPYSKIFPAFGAGAAVTHAAGLGGKRFIDFRKPHACVSAFIQQHGSKCAPARIEHRLGLSPIRDLGVNRPRSVSMAGALCAGHTDIQIPASAAVFTEAPCTRFEVPQSVAIPQRQPTSGEVDLSASIANRSDLEGNPAQRPACTATLAPSQPDSSMLSAPPREFFRCMLVLHPQAQDPNSAGRSIPGHPYSIPIILQNTGKTARNPQERLPLSLAGLNAGVSREELG